MNLAPVRKEIVVQAAPEHAFQVFVEGGWWPATHSILASGSPRKAITIEPSAGGRWYETGEDGSQCDWGQVLAWEPPRRLLLGWQINGNFEADASATTEVEVNFIPEGKATRVTVEHRGFDGYPETGEALRKAVGSDDGWGGLLTKFAASVAEEGHQAAPASAQAMPPAQRFFVCKLITPRPASFMMDMSEQEGAALGQHVEYWTSLARTGRALVFGPVGDPSGVWGLGVITATDEKEADLIAREDPSLKAGLGFAYEVYPMLRTVLGSR